MQQKSSKYSKLSFQDFRIVQFCVTNVDSSDGKDRHEDMSNQKQPTKARRKVV